MSSRCALAVLKSGDTNCHALAEVSTTDVLRAFGPNVIGPLVRLDGRGGRRVAHYSTDLSTVEYVVTHSVYSAYVCSTSSRTIIESRLN